MNINWFPGHMKKAMDQMKQQLKLIDIIIELIDARNPISSRNPMLSEIAPEKPRVVVITKSDLADEKTTALWEQWFRNEGNKTIRIDPRQRSQINSLIKVTNDAAKELFEKRKDKGWSSQRLRLMIIGVPNVGKSTLINMLAGKKSANVGNKPGVTKGQQWIKVGNEYDLLDTPGVLWHKFSEDWMGYNLAFTGAIKDDILDRETLALKLIEELLFEYSNNLEDRYKIEITIDDKPIDVMEKIASKRGFVSKGGMVDYNKTANVVLDEFRKGLFGGISLEKPGQYD
ncbi:MAG: ribosome biogenesis GTPase YlqF [Tissierellia bacterium]|nr:ribosome biogenesis GTPase YlqF [Tissierellia bacterium]